MLSLNKQFMPAACRKMIFLWTLLLAGTLAVSAQREQPKGKLPHWSAEQKVRKLSIRQARELHLTGSQQVRMTAINREYAQGIDELRSGAGMDPKTRMEKLKALHEKRARQYRQVLNASQFKHWNDLEMAQQEKLRTYKAKRRKKILHEEQSAGDPLPVTKDIRK